MIRYLKSPRSLCAVAACVLLGLGVGIGAVVAAPLDETADLRGQAISQRFLPSGASIVVTTDSTACVVSRRIAIETSVYVDPDGSLIPFAGIRRSIAASVQAVGPQIEGPQTEGLPTGALGFRIQLKYSPAPGTPILLTLDGQQTDLQSLLEPSRDSLWIDGPQAAALQAAFSAGERPLLRATSADTAHLVTDHLDAPDLAALATCQAMLSAPPTGVYGARYPVPLTNEIRVSFTADPATTPLATLPELRSCGMTDAPGILHLARLDAVTGFFAQTDKVFVAFDADGAVAQVYIPGIFDADFRDGAEQVRLSQAADGNLPTARNAVKGCLGASSVNICRYDLGRGGYLLGSCLGTGGPGTGQPVPDTVALTGGTPPDGPFLGGRTPGDILAGFTPVRPGGGTGGGPNPPGGGPNPPGGGGGDPDPPDPDPPDPSPVPLPATALLLLGAVAGLGGMRRRRRG